MQPMPNPANYFAGERARELAKRSWEIRLARKQAANDAAKMPAPAEDGSPANPYHSQRLLRVRMQINLLDKEIRNCIEDGVEDAGRLDRMVSAQSRLSEQERVLSGRPLPGSLRPRAGKQSGQPKSSQAIADEGVDDGTPNA